MGFPKQTKYLNYALLAIRSLRSETGVTLTEIVRYIKTTTDETKRHRLLFAKVREATNRAIKDGLLERCRYRLSLRYKAAEIGSPFSSESRSDTSSLDRSETDESTEDDDDEESIVESTESSSGESDEWSDRKIQVTARNGDKKRQSRKIVASPKRVSVLGRRSTVASRKVDKKKGNAHRDCVNEVNPDGRKRKRPSQKSEGVPRGTSAKEKRGGNNSKDDCAGPDPKISRLAGNDQDKAVGGPDTGKVPTPSGSKITEEEKRLPGTVEAGGEKPVVIKQEKLETVASDKAGDAEKAAKKVEAEKKAKKKEEEKKKKTDDRDYDFYT